MSGGALRKAFAKDATLLAIENEVPVILIHASGKIELITGGIKLPKEILNKYSEAGIRLAFKLK